MARKRFLLISADFRKQPDADLLQARLDKALDWIQYFPNQWLLWTSSSATQWYSRLKPFLSDGDHIMVLEVRGSRRAGRMPSVFWEFIRQRAAEDAE